VKIEGSVAFVTGANRGLGRAFARALVDRGARKVYAGVRDPETVTDSDLVPVRLDVTRPDEVAAAAQACSDVNLLINNAGIALGTPLIHVPTVDSARAELEVNYFGTLAMARAFAPVLAANGGGALVNMLSVLSFLNLPFVGSYSASKAAAWSLTNGIRIELAAQGTLVVAVHAAFIDTDMSAGVNEPKIAPQDVAAQTMDAIESDAEEVLADQTSRQVKAALPHDLAMLYPDVRKRWAEHAG
jgi:NAD(P)-dependent dehydrogenase (short-subunit alcohol dehydrogenase family)